MWRIDPQVAVIVFLITFVVGRLVSRRAIALLDAGQKVQLVDGAALPRIVAPVVLLVLVGVYFLALKRFPEYGRGLQVGFFTATVLLVLCAIVLTQLRVRRLNLPPRYLQLVSVAQAVQFLGAALLLATLVAE